MRITFLGPTRKLYLFPEVEKEQKLNVEKIQRLYFSHKTSVQFTKR